MPRIVRSVLVVFALLLSLFVIPTAAGAAPEDGNSAAAKACEEGGYVNYVRTDGTAFKNSGDCTRYVAQGGQLVVPATASLTVTIRIEGGFFYLTISGSGLLPGSPVTFIYTISGQSGSYSPGTVAENGTFSLVDWGAMCGAVQTLTVSATRATGGTITADGTPGC